MPVQLASFLIPRNSNTWYLVEDKFVKGGLQVLLNHAARDSINPLNLKAGQLVITQNDNRVWQLQADMVSWTEFIPASNYNPFYTHKQPIPLDSWLVAHSKNCSYFNCSVYDSNGHLVLPDSIEILDANTVLIKFIVPLSGQCSMAFDLRAGV